MIPLMLRMMASEAAMMGRQSGDQDSLFYQFRLDDRIPKDHLLRRINVFVTLVLRYARATEALLQRDRPAIGRS